MRQCVTTEERERLKHICVNATDARLKKRAGALLDLDAGDSPDLVARRYKVARSTVYNWIKRYRARGVSDEALRDLPRSGRPRADRTPVERPGSRDTR
jgi:transposase